MTLDELKRRLTATQGGLVEPPRYTRVDTHHGMPVLQRINDSSDKTKIVYYPVYHSPTPYLGDGLVEQDWGQLCRTRWAMTLWHSERIEVVVEAGKATITDYGHNVVYGADVWLTDEEEKQHRAEGEEA